MPSILRRFIDWQIKLSNSFDKLLPERYRIDGNRDYLDNILPRFINDTTIVYDVGGGRDPYISAETSKHRDLLVTGIDIDAHELSSAPQGAYDKIIAADITRYKGHGDADLVICQATLEHVTDNTAALRNIASILKPGGKAVLFQPSRNAVFARLNLILPEALKKKLLFTLLPGKAEGHDGFKAYYNRCTPKDFRKLATDSGLQVREEHLYFKSSYFSFFTPLYILWRLWVLIFHAIAGKQAAETFVMVLEKPADANSIGRPPASQTRNKLRATAL